MARERIQTRADADTLEQVEEYADEMDISYSEAVRRLVRTGLIEKGYREGEGGGETEYAEAHIAPLVREIGGAMIGVTAAILLLVQVGVL
jgi:predicted transcriptional regulator